MAPPPSEDRPGDAETAAREALARARRHARSSVAEALEALCALLDAASLSATGVSATAHPLFAATARRLARWSHALAAEGTIGSELGAALAGALDEEIARWEERARDDPDARAVLRAFLGLRELLWELGVRPAPRGEAAGAERGSAVAGAADGGAPESHGEAATRRTQRVPVEG